LVLLRFASNYVLETNTANDITLNLTVINAGSELIESIIIVDEFDRIVSFNNSEPYPLINGSSFVWSIGDLEPSGSKNITINITINPGDVDTTWVDTGMTIYGTKRGEPIYNTYDPWYFATTRFGQYLQSFVDADTSDQYVLVTAALLGGNLTRIFEFVRDDIDYEVYKGSLRGARGTIWGLAGNSYDQSNLLIALLRNSGIPARYQHGTLNLSRSQELILSMFPKFTGSVVGIVPDDAEVSDPANDTELIEEAQDHEWVEYYNGTDWVSLDPSYKHSTIGQNLTSSTETYIETPDKKRHFVTISVLYEKFDMWYQQRLISGEIFGDDIRETSLRYKIATAGLVGRNVFLRHDVNSQYSDKIPEVGPISITNTYIPQLHIDDEVIQGDVIEEKFFFYPPGIEKLTYEIIGEWLTFDVKAPGEEAERYERVIFDKIGFVERYLGVIGWPMNVSLQITGSDIYSISFLPCEIEEEIEKLLSKRFGLIFNETEKAKEQYEEEEISITNFARSLQKYSAELLFMQGILYGYRSDFASTRLSEVFCINAYYNSPRIVISSLIYAKKGDDLFLNVGIDLRKNNARVIGRPSQNISAIFQFRMSRGFIDAEIERQVIEDLLQSLEEKNDGIEISSISVSKVFQVAKESGIELILFNKNNIFLLESKRFWDHLGINLSIEARVRIIDAVVNGYHVIVPKKMINIGNLTTIGWYQIDPITGETMDVMENGLHMSASTFIIIVAILIIIIGVGFFVYGVITGDSGYILLGSFLISFGTSLLLCSGPNLVIFSSFKKVLFKTLTTTGECIKSDDEIEEETDSQSLDPHFTQLVDLYDSFLNLVDPPLPVIITSYFPPTTASYSQYPLINNTVIGSAFSTNIFGIPKTSHSIIDGQQNLEWSATINNSFQYNNIYSQSATLYTPTGTLLGDSDNITISPNTSAYAFISGDCDYSIDGRGKVSFYSPATSGLSAGGSWDSYSADVTSNTGQIIIELSDAIIQTDKNTYEGHYIVKTNAAIISGTHCESTMSYTKDANITVNGGNVQIGDAYGEMNVGEVPVDISQGLSIVDFTGTINISEQNSTYDNIEISGEGRILELILSPEQVTTHPDETNITISYEIRSQETDTYTVNCTVPEGWGVTTYDDGTIQVLPQLGTLPDIYEIFVYVESQSEPTLYTTAVTFVTIPDYTDVSAEVVLDTLFYIPHPDCALVQFKTAYLVNITNRGNSPDTYSIEPWGLDPTWFDQSVEEIYIEPGYSVGVGLYIMTPDMFIPPGDYPFYVNVTSLTNSSINETVEAFLSIPYTHGAYPYTDRDIYYTIPNGVVSLHR